MTRLPHATAWTRHRNPPVPGSSGPGLIRAVYGGRSVCAPIGRALVMFIVAGACSREPIHLDDAAGPPVVRRVADGGSPPLVRVPADAAVMPPIPLAPRRRARVELDVRSVRGVPIALDRLPQPTAASPLDDFDLDVEVRWHGVPPGLVRGVLEVRSPDGTVRQTVVSERNYKIGYRRSDAARGPYCDPVAGVPDSCPPSKVVQSSADEYVALRTTSPVTIHLKLQPGMYRLSATLRLDCEHARSCARPMKLAAKAVEINLSSRRDE